MLKKNQAFIKKVRLGFTAQLVTEAASLSLAKFLDELIISILNAPLKSNSIQHAVALIRLFPTMDLSVLLSKWPSTARLSTELYFNHLIQFNLLDLINLITTQDHSSIAPQFIKWFKSDLSNPIPIPDRLLLDQQTLAQITSKFTLFYNNQKSILINQHNRMLSIKKSNNECFIARGEILSERQEKYQDAVLLVEKLKKDLLVISDFLNLEMPTLKADDTVVIGQGIGISNDQVLVVEKDFSSGVWEDEDTRFLFLI